LKILIAEDDFFFRRLLHQLLASESELVMVADGTAAWQSIQEAEGPVMAILDWVMPGMVGPEICRAARANVKTSGSYLILLTARDSPADILAGLRSGADDYVTKPFRPEELRSRVRLGQRILRMEQLLTAQTSALESSRAREVSLQNRLAAMERGELQQSMARGAAAGASCTNSLDTITSPPEMNTSNNPLPILPVNNSKVS
jgi:DNA-binding response OmpR family regulator